MEKNSALLLILLGNKPKNLQPRPNSFQVAAKKAYQNKQKIFEILDLFINKHEIYFIFFRKFT